MLRILTFALLASAPLHAQSLIRIDGSSSVFPVTEAVAQQFQVRERGKARVMVGISGTRGGFRKFCRGETDVQDASRPIGSEEMEACRSAGVKYYEIPVAFDALTVAVNRENTWAQSMTVEQLRRIWEPAAQGRIARWNQIDPSWPDEPLVLFGAGADSGTFEYFTQAIVGEVGSSRTDYIGSEDDNVLVRGIENNRYALGYIPFAYYAAHKDRLKALAIDNGAGAVLPAPENVANGTYVPLSRPLFIYVNARSADRPEVRGFIEFFLAHGAPLIREVKYLPLADESYQLALRNFREGKLGTATGGEPQTRIDVGALLVREAGL
jgi:phosphate transport system substrate-binding protein